MINNILVIGASSIGRRDIRYLKELGVKNVRDKGGFFSGLKKVKSRGVKFEINCFYLMKSELKSEGVVYNILDKFDLI